MPSLNRNPHLFSWFLDPEVSQKSAEEGFGAAESNHDGLPDEFYDDVSALLN